MIGFLVKPGIFLAAIELSMFFIAVLAIFTSVISTFYQEVEDINWVADTVWVIFIRLESVYYISYVSLQSFMSSEQSVK